MRWLALALALFAAPATGEEIVSGLSQNRVSITADFDGTELIVYGAVKRDAPPPDAAPLEVIVTVEGPSTPIIIRRKERVAGIWINQDKTLVDAAPTFYAIVTTAPLQSILSNTEDLRHRISIPRAIRAVGMSSEVADPEVFLESLLRIRQNADVYRLLQGRMEFVEQTLFRADVVLPANLTEGDYLVRLFLTRDGEVVDTQQRVIGVRKEGLERFLFNLAQEQPLIYGLLALLLAVVAGWGASAAFRLVRA